MRMLPEPVLALMVGPPPLTDCGDVVLVEVALQVDGLGDVDSAGAGMALRLKAVVLPTVRWMLPEPVPSFQSLVGLPAASISPEPVWAWRPPEIPVRWMEPEPVCGTDVAGAGLVEFNAAGAGLRLAGPWMPRAWTEPEPVCALRLEPTSWMSRSPEPEEATMAELRGRVMS